MGLRIKESGTKLQLKASPSINPDCWPDHHFSGIDLISPPLRGTLGSEETQMNLSPSSGHSYQASSVSWPPPRTLRNCTRSPDLIRHMVYQGLPHSKQRYCLDLHCLNVTPLSFDWRWGYKYSWDSVHHLALTHTVWLPGETFWDRWLVKPCPDSYVSNYTHYYPRAQRLTSTLNRAHNWTLDSRLSPNFLLPPFPVLISLPLSDVRGC